MSEDEEKGAGQGEPSFMVEVRDLRGGGDRFELHDAKSATKKIVGATEDMLVAVRNAVTDVCKMAQGAFEAANRPDEIEVKFGVTLGAKGSGGWVVFVTEASGEATLELTAKWKNKKAE